MTSKFFLAGEEVEVDPPSLNLEGEPSSFYLGTETATGPVSGGLTGGTTSTSTSTSLLRIGSSGNAVRELQLALASLGYDVGPIDGIFGPKTDAAVRAFQADAGITVDGLVGPITRAALGDAQAGTAPAEETTTDGRTSDGSSVRDGSLGRPSIGQPLGVLLGGETIRVATDDGLVRWYQIYEFPAGSGQFVAYQYNDEAQVKVALGEGFQFVNRSETWVNSNVLAFATAEEVIGRTESFARLTQEVIQEAALAAGLRDPSLVGLIASDPEMQQIMAQAMIGDWTPQQILAAQRQTSFWQNTLYPGISEFYGKTTNPEGAWVNYRQSVEPALTSLGYQRDPDGTYNSLVGNMLSQGIDAQIFLENVEVFQRAVQNQSFFDIYQQRVSAELGKTIGFGEWFDLLAGETTPELQRVAEGAMLAYQAQQASVNLGEGSLQRLISETDLSDQGAANLFSSFNQAILALGELGLSRGGLTRDEVLSAAAGINPETGRSVEEVRLAVAKLARENDLFDEEKIQFYVGFTPSGTPFRPGLQVLAPEGA